MKTRFLNKMAGLLAVLLLFSCTGKFEEYNTDNTGFTDEQKTYDYNTFGVWLKVVQMGIYFNYDWGSGKNWHFQTMQNLNADMFSGYMHDFKPFNAGLGNTVYNLQDGWNGTMWDNTYGYIMTEINKSRKTKRDGCEKRNAFIETKTKCASNLIRKVTAYLQNQSKTPSLYIKINGIQMDF